MSSVNLQPLELKDWQLLRAMRIRAVTTHPDLFYDSVEGATNYEPSYWQRLLAGSGNKFFALFDEQECVGITGIITWDGDKSGQTGMIGYSFIDPEYRGKGFVDLLYGARLEHAIDHTAWKKLITDHRAGNESSRKAISKYGFVLTEKVLIDWPDGSRDYEYRYELDLEKLRRQSLQTGI
jgi:RimJ/RimL family protein N-acetyltransferase